MPRKTHKPTRRKHSRVHVREMRGRYIQKRWDRYAREGHDDHILDLDHRFFTWRFWQARAQAAQLEEFIQKTDIWDHGPDYPLSRKYLPRVPDHICKLFWVDRTRFAQFDDRFSYYCYNCPEGACDYCIKALNHAYQAGERRWLANELEQGLLDWQEMEF